MEGRRISQRYASRDIALSSYGAMIFSAFYSAALLKSFDTYHLALSCYALFGLYKVMRPSRLCSLLSGLSGAVIGAFLVLVGLLALRFIHYRIFAIDPEIDRHCLIICLTVAGAFVFTRITRSILAILPDSTYRGANLFGVIGVFLSLVLGWLLPLPVAVAMYWYRIKDNEDKLGKHHPDFAAYHASIKSQEWQHVKDADFMAAKTKPQSTTTASACPKTERPTKHKRKSGLDRDFDPAYSFEPSNVFYDDSF